VFATFTGDTRTAWITGLASRALLRTDFRSSDGSQGCLPHVL